MAMTARQRAKVSLYVQAGIFVVVLAAVILAVDWKTVGNSVFNFAKIRRKAKERKLRDEMLTNRLAPQFDKA